MNFENIDKALDIESTEVDTEIVKKEPSQIRKTPSQEEQIQKDYECCGGHLYSMMV